MNTQVKKYELLDDQQVTTESGKTLRRIRALIDIPAAGVKAGDLGGHLEGEHNLSHSGACWVFDSARVFGSACVYDSARVCNSARVFGSARVFDSAQVFGSARVFDSAQVFDSACVFDSAHVFGSARVYDSACVFGSARVCDSACVCDSVQVTGGTFRGGKALLTLGRADGYSKGLADVAGVAYIGAGCRWFTLAEAHQHWDGNPDRVDTSCLLKAADAFADLKGLSWGEA